MAQDHSETPVDVDETSTNPAGDIEMAEDGAPAEAQENLPEGSELPFADGDDAVPPRISFMEYLASPVVNLVIGQSERQTLLAAHQALLAKSPFFQSACQGFVDDGSVSHALHVLPPQTRRARLPRYDGLTGL